MPELIMAFPAFQIKLYWPGLQIMADNVVFEGIQRAS